MFLLIGILAAYIHVSPWFWVVYAIVGFLRIAKLIGETERSS